MRASVFALSHLAPAALVASLGGCGFSATPGNGPSGAQPDASEAAPPIDAAVDGAPLDGTAQPICLGAFVNVCVDPPDASITLMTQELNTSTSARCRPYTATPAVDACVI